MDCFDNGGSNWQKRFQKGNPGVVNFICGTQNVFGCDDSHTISYKGIGRAAANMSSRMEKVPT